MLNRIRSLSENSKLIIISVVLFAAILPLVLQMYFPQNDDWAFRITLQSYLNGDFTTSPTTLFNKPSPMFLTQGIMSIPFVAIFGFERLSVLTLIVAVTNFYILAKILIKYFSKPFIDSVLISLLVFFNPLFIYSILGYMTEQYFLLFFLLASYDLLKFDETKKKKYFYITNVFIVVGFFVRQINVFFSLAYALYLLFTKRRKLGLIQLIVTFGLLAFYKVYTSNPGLDFNGPDFENLMSFSYIFTIIIGILIYISAFLFPYLLTHLNIVESYKENKTKTIRVGFLLISFSVLLVIAIFQPEGLFSAEFPYFGNTVNKYGFHLTGLPGDKINFYGSYDAYLVWEVIAIFLVGIFPLLVIKKYKQLKNNFFVYFFVIYTASLLIAVTVYDRYITYIIVTVVLLISSLYKEKIFKNYEKMILVGFIAVLMFLNYQFGSDYVLRKQYIWERAHEIEGDKSKILAGTSWHRLYKTHKPDYFFSYASPDKIHRVNAELIEIHEIEYPLMFYVDNKMYLYKIIR